MAERTRKLVASNRRARHDYEILETFEAGVVLTGSEIKSVRAGHISLKGAFAFEQAGELFIDGLHIAEYLYANRQNHLPERRRKLLMHRREIVRLAAKVNERGLSLVPLQAYFLGPRLKLELALVRGRRHGDKREELKRRDAEMEMRRANARDKGE